MSGRASLHSLEELDFNKNRQLPMNDFLDVDFLNLNENDRDNAPTLPYGFE
jgi:hypothetical protein